MDTFIQSLRAFRWPDPFGSGRLLVVHHCVFSALMGCLFSALAVAVSAAVAATLANALGTD